MDGDADTHDGGNGGYQPDCYFYHRSIPRAFVYIQTDVGIVLHYSFFGATVFLRSSYGLPCRVTALTRLTRPTGFSRYT